MALDPQVWLTRELPGWDKNKLVKLAKGLHLHKCALEAAQSAGVEDLEELSNLLHQLATYEW